MFLRNAWYVAAIEREVSRRLLPVTILGERIVLFTKEDGTPVALEDACPHRKLPLSMGRLQGDDVECGYHGLRFDCSGACTRVPGAERIPHVARVRSYPLAARYGLVWIWMGDAAAADPALIFQIEHWDDAGWGRTDPESMSVDCNYLYVTDNLLDPSHVAWVHASSFGNAACEETPLQTELHDDGVVVSRWMLDTEVAPFYQQFVSFTGNTDRQQHYEVRFPSNAIIKAVFTPANTGGPQGTLHPDTFLMDSYNFMTPIDDRHTRYFWFQMRNFAPGDADVSQRFAAAVRGAFEEDRVVLNAVQWGMDHKQTPNLDLKIDLGPMRFRRRLDQLIAQETSVPQAAE